MFYKKYSKETEKPRIVIFFEYKLNLFEEDHLIRLQKFYMKICLFKSEIKLRDNTCFLLELN